MAVIATAGHVDHGKSTLVRALTGMEPDRWAEEKRRGMTIDLGYAWTILGGRRLAFVDVPGHERYVGSMIAGVGPVAGVLFVVAADDGWRPQSQEHAEAIAALGLRHVLLAVTRRDLADPAEALAGARARLAGLGIAPEGGVAVSGVTGEGLPALREALVRLAAGLPAGEPLEPVRLWVDRSFTIKGAGTVVTGTLPSGTVSVEDELELDGRVVRVRGLQSCGETVAEVAGPARVAVNLRGVPVESVGRGQALLTPGAFTTTSVLDVRLDRRGDIRPLPAEATLHVGTAAATVRIRPLGDRHARLTLLRAGQLPFAPGDRAFLRDPGRRQVLAGVVVMDPAPALLSRRGAARSRGAQLEALADGELPAGDQAPGAGPAQPGRPAYPAGRSAGLDALLSWLRAHPLDAPTAEQLAAWAPTGRELAEAERAGDIARMAGVVVSGDILARAEAALAGLGDGFAVGDAARAMGTSRRVAVPVLERLDAALVTRRHPDGRRSLRR